MCALSSHKHQPHAACTLVTTSHPTAGNSRACRSLQEPPLSKPTNWPAARLNDPNNPPNNNKSRRQTATCRAAAPACLSPGHLNTRASKTNPPQAGRLRHSILIPSHKHCTKKQTSNLIQTEPKPPNAHEHSAPCPAQNQPQERPSAALPGVMRCAWRARSPAPPLQRPLPAAC